MRPQYSRRTASRPDVLGGELALARGVLLAAALGALASSADALPVRVALEWPCGRPPASERARVQANLAAGPASEGVRFQAEAGPDGVVLELAEGVWRLQPEAPGYWSPGAEVVVSPSEPARVRLALWPAASLETEIRTSEGDPLPSDLHVSLSPVSPASGLGTCPAGPAARPAPASSPTELRCAVGEGRWRCPGPPGLFDVRLEAAGHAPRYAWDVRLEPGKSVDLGPTLLRRAASVFGRGVMADGSSPPGPCHAILQRSVERRGTPGPGAERESCRETALCVPLSQRGYFQFEDVPPGTHALALECDAASAVRELHVRSQRETRIDPALRLEDLALDVIITPKLDPAGRPWHLTADATAPRWRRVVENATASEEGRFTRRGLTAGGYRVDLVSADGRQWMQRFVELDARSAPVSMRLGLVHVSGRVHLNGQALRAQLVFFNEAGGEPATLTSDTDGRFEGLLPTAPDAAESRFVVEAQAAQPALRRRLTGVSVRPSGSDASAWLELALPPVAVRGTVESEAGEPRVGVTVSFADASGGARTAVATDDAGGFDVADLPAGSYTAIAESRDGASERTPLDIVDGVESELHLVLHPAERAAFHVVGSGGPVPDAAVQVWVAPGIPHGVARTDAEGRFEAPLPPETAEVGLTIGAPGHALKLARLPASGEQTITLRASGGTLVLDLRRPGRVLDDGIPYLVHDGAIEAVGALAGWSGADGAAGTGPTVVEAIEPGAYALCVADPAELGALWRGVLPNDRCRRGAVEDGRTLILSLP